MFKENEHERFWFLFAFIVFIIFAWSLISVPESRYPLDIDAQEQQAIEQSWP